MNSGEGVVVTLIDRHDHVGISTQFLDIDARTKTLALGADDNDAHLRIAAKSFDLLGDRRPFLAVEGVNRRLVKTKVSDVAIEGHLKRCHVAITPASHPTVAS